MAARAAAQARVGDAAARGAAARRAIEWPDSDRGEDREMRGMIHRIASMGAAEAYAGAAGPKCVPAAFGQRCGKSRAPADFHDTGTVSN
jgi:hypothetical protein